MNQLKNNIMTRWGVGSKFAIITIMYSILIYYIQDYYSFLPKFNIPAIIGYVIIAIGFGLFIYPAVTIDKYFNNKEIRTNGLYSICRHPIYASWIVIIIPGIVLLWGSYLAISIPFFSYLVLKLYIKKEEDYMKELFPYEYRYYMKKVNAIFPKLIK